ncbi:MAG TPA: dienelactone hydrolase family protein [Opitutaceae bacterium]
MKRDRSVLPESGEPEPGRALTARIVAGDVELEGILRRPREARGVVLFAHGSGSSRHSPRNRGVARLLRDAGLATLLFDLLTAEEEEAEAATAHLRFDIELLAGRLCAATRWAENEPAINGLRLGYFGSSTGAAAALVAAAQMSGHVHAVVSRGGRPDLAAQALVLVTAPTLLIVGGADHEVIALNQQAYERLTARKRLEIIPGATHLFEEPGALERVAQLSADWFLRHLAGAPPS